MLSTIDGVSSIPVIDLGPSYSASPEQRKLVADQIRAASRDIGFFYVRNHDVPQDAIDATIAVSKRFFARSMDEKMPLLGEGGYGYDPPQLQALDVGTPPDLKEGFMMGPPESEIAQTVKWPADMPEFRAQLEAYDAHMHRLGRHIMRCIALSLDLSEDYFEDGLDKPASSVRVLHYTPRPPDAPADQIGAGAHTDWGAITILYQDDVGGLEVKGTDGAWIKATPIPGTYVINLGDMIRRWTNDGYLSTVHRVMCAPPGKERYSIATFFNPRDDYRVECVPTCVEPGKEPHYPPCTVGEHILEMVRKTYGG
jgi:isopenicillin N synthase-like dioxygenase